MLLIVYDYGNNNNNELFYFIIIFYFGGGGGSIVFTSKRKGACRNHYEQNYSMEPLTNRFHWFCQILNPHIAFVYHFVSQQSLCYLPQHFNWLLLPTSNSYRVDLVYKDNMCW